MTTSPTSVYIMTCGEFTKIGVTANAKARLKGINTGSPQPSVLYRSRQFPSKEQAHRVEARLHRLFSRFRSNGEWFAISKEKAWSALRRLDVPKPRPPGQKKSHHCGPDDDAMALEELREAMNATERAYYPTPPIERE